MPLQKSSVLCGRIRTDKVISLRLGVDCRKLLCDVLLTQRRANRGDRTGLDVD